MKTFRSYSVFLLLLTTAVFLRPSQACSQILSDEITRDLSGVVSVIEGDYLAVVYEQTQGVDVEMAFTRNNSIRFVNRRGWDEIRIGDEVKVTYTESLRTETFRDETGKTLSHEDVIARNITVLAFTEPLKTPLASGKPDE